MTRPQYTITVFANKEAKVTKAGFGYCESFSDRNFRADAIRYVKRVGGSGATFEFENWKNDALESV